ncbi:MAG: hypothetical protein ACI4M3_00835 [Acutalibacteraceae bacterium]
MNSKIQKCRKLRRLYVALCLLASLVCLASAGITLAQWRKADETVNRISVGTIRGMIVGFDDPECTVNVSETIPKSASVQNTGDLDACVRTKVETRFGYSRTSDGKLVDDVDVSADSIHINYNLDDWYYCEADGYYYYKGVIAPNEITTTLFDSLTVSASFKTTSQIKADITVVMEMVQAAESGLSYWNMTPEELGISYLPASREQGTATVTFKAPSDGFEFGGDNGDLFMNFKNLVPGCTRTQEIKISNQWKSDVTLYLRAEESEKNSTDSEQIKKLFDEHIRITITDSEGTILSSGTDGLLYGEELLLGHLASGEEKNLNVNMYFDNQADNTVAGMVENVKWVFIAEGKDSDNDSPVIDSPDDVVETGDHSFAFMMMTISLVSFAVFLFLIFSIRKIDQQS